MGKLGCAWMIYRKFELIQEDEETGEVWNTYGGTEIFQIPIPRSFSPTNGA